jgi:serine protease Do
MQRVVWLCAIVGLCAPLAGAQVMPQSLIANTHTRLEPALCLVRYSAEVRSTNTGETSRREVRALGVLATKDGLVMTHGHMAVTNSEPLNVRVEVGHGDDQKTYSATLLEKPDDVNVCFLQIETDEPVSFPYVTFRRGSSLSLGEPILVFGMLNEPLDFMPSFLVRHVGVILEKPRKTYTADADVGFNFVSGPVVNSAGEVVGIIGYDLSTGQGGQRYTRSGHPLIYQTDLFMKYIDDPPVEESKKEEGYLGVLTQPLTDEFAEYWDLPQDGGIVVSTVLQGSPADEAGLQSGDVIFQFNDMPVSAKLDRDVLEFTEQVKDAGIGNEADIQYYRGGDTQTAHVVLAPRPKAAADADEYEDETFGFEVAEITTDLRLRLNIADGVEGVMVLRVRSGGWAHLAGMRRGVIVLRFGEYPVTNLDEFREAVEKTAALRPPEVPVFCRVGSRTGFFRLQPRWDDADG